MSQSLDGILRDILVRHGTALLGDQRRFEACIRDTSLSPRDISAALAALKSGIPAQFLQFQTSGLTAVAIANYAALLAEETGLNENFSRTTLEAWAYALRVDVLATSPPQVAPPELPKQSADDKLKATPAPGRGSNEGAAPHPQPDVVPATAAARAGEVLKRVGFVFYGTVVGAVMGTVVALVFGFVKAMLGGGGAVSLAGASVVGIGWFGAVTALLGAHIGKEMAEGKAPNKAADAAAWVVAVIVALLCLSFLFRN